MVGTGRSSPVIGSGGGVGEGLCAAERLGLTLGEAVAADGVAQADWLGFPCGVLDACPAGVLAGVFGGFGRLMFTPPLCVMDAGCDVAVDSQGTGTLAGATPPYAYADMPEAARVPMLTAMKAFLICICHYSRSRQ
jgi:hypothetical protein